MERLHALDAELPDGLTVFLDGAEVREQIKRFAIPLNGETYGLAGIGPQSWAHVLERLDALAIHGEHSIADVEAGAVGRAAGDDGAGDRQEAWRAEQGQEQGEHGDGDADIGRRPCRDDRHAR